MPVLPISIAGSHPKRLRKRCCSIRRFEQGRCESSRRTAVCLRPRDALLAYFNSCALTSSTRVRTPRLLASGGSLRKVELREGIGLDAGSARGDVESGRVSLRGGDVEKRPQVRVAGARNWAVKQTRDWFLGRNEFGFPSEAKGISQSGDADKVIDSKWLAQIRPLWYSVAIIVSTHIILADGTKLGFSSALGLGQSDAELLRAALLEAAREEDAVPGEADEYGARYTVDFLIAHGDRETRVRSTWTILRGESAPRLTSCFVL